MNNLVQLAWLRARLQLKAEARKTYLGYLWWIIEPSLHLGVYWLVFGLLITRPIDNLIPFLIIGVTHWLWFSKTVSNSTMSIVQGRQLISQTTLNKMIFPLTVIFQDAIKQCIVFGVLLLTLFFISDYVWSWWWLVICGIELTLIIGCATIVAAIIPLFPDARIITSTGLQLLMFMSGIFYDISAFSEETKTLFMLNPLALLIHESRAVLINGLSPSLSALLYIFSWSGVLMLTGFILIKRLNNRFAQLLAE